MRVGADGVILSSFAGNGREVDREGAQQCAADLRALQGDPAQGCAAGHLQAEPAAQAAAGLRHVPEPARTREEQG